MVNSLPSKERWDREHGENSLVHIVGDACLMASQLRSHLFWSSHPTFLKGLRFFKNMEIIFFSDLSFLFFFLRKLCVCVCVEKT